MVLTRPRFPHEFTVATDLEHCYKEGIMEPIKWEHGTMSRQPLGYSDIYWCKEKNGPTVYMGKGEEYRKAYRCQLCGQRLADDPYQHDFVVHIDAA
jgi:hypothetical protein